MQTTKRTGSDFIEFDRALNEGIRLIKGEDHQKRILGLYIVVSINLGLRIGDMLSLTWLQLRSHEVVLIEKKTGKKRVLAVNQHIRSAVSLFDEQMEGPVFVSQKKSVYSIQSINVMLKEVFAREAKSLAISSHSLRKTFSIAVYRKLGETESALVYLSEILNHTSLKVTRIYLGLRQQEINNIYLSL